MGPSLKDSLGHWLLRGNNLLLPKIPENELFALKVWGKNIEKTKRKMWNSNPQPPEW